jgi:copper resistance protein D
MAIAVLVLARTLHIGSAMMLFALPYFMLVILRPAFSVAAIENYSSFCRKMTSWLGIALMLEAISGVVWFWLVVAQTRNQSPWDVPGLADFDAALWQTQFGRLWLIRGVMEVAFGLTLYFVARGGTLLSSGFSLLNWILVTLSGDLLVTLAWAGHAVAGIHRQILHLMAVIPHLLVGAVWPTGLIPMAYFLWSMKKRGKPLPAGREIEILERFSQASLIAVLILAATGSINGWLMIGSWENLIGTTNGRLLLGKILVVAIMIGLGAFNRYHLMPRIHDVPVLVRTLGKTVVAESCLALVVLFIVGMHT